MKVRHLHRPLIEFLEERVVLATWTGAYAYLNPGATGNLNAWSKPQNWFDDVVPGAGATAEFTDDFDFTLNGVEFQHPLSFTPNLDSSTSASIDLDTSWTGTLSVDNGASLTLASSVWDGGDIDIDTGGAVINPSGATLTLANPQSAPTFPVLTGDFTNQGTIDQAGAAPLVLEGTIDNEAGGTYNILTDFGISPFLNAADAFINSGTINMSAAGTVDFDTSLSNTGGTIDVQSGTLIPWGGNAGASTGGTFIVASGATMQYSSEIISTTFTGNYTGSGGGQFILNADTIDIGAGGATFDFPAGFFQWQLGGYINATAGTLTNSGSITATSGPTGDANLSGTLDNTGTITLAGSGNFVGGTIDNQSGALIDVQGVDSAEYPFVFATIDNSGTIDSSSTGAVGIWILNNDSGGAIDVETGTLSPWVQEGGVSTGGTFTVADGATLQYNSGSEGSTFTGTYTGSGGGQFLVDSGELNVGVGGATFNFPGDMLQWTGGDINVALGDLTNNGTINLAGSGEKELLNDGTLNNFGTIVQTGSGDFALFSHYTFPATLMNELGASYLIESDSGLDSPLGYHTAIDNAGTIEKTAGTGTATLDVLLTLSNTGTIEADSGTLSLSGPITQVSGTTLTAGTWNALAGSTLAFPDGTNITANQGNIAVDGQGASITGIQNLSSSSGSLAFTNGASFTTAGAFSNTGSLTVGAGSTLAVTGNYTQGTSASLTIGIAGTAASGQFGQLAATGSATLGGSVATTLAAGFNPISGEGYTIASYASQTGGSSLAFNGLSSGRYTFFQQLVCATSIVLNTTTSAADLAAQPFSAPTGGMVGQSITINYQVNNDSSTAATGNWVDSFYLSTSQTLSTSAVLLGRVSHVGGVAANGNYEGTLNAAVPPLDPTNYWVIEVADSQGLVPDVNRANATVVSSNPILVGVSSITLGDSASGTIASGQELLYQVAVPAGHDVQFSVNSGAAGAVELYERYQQAADPSNYDVISFNPSQTTQTVELSNTQAGTYYVLLQGSSLAGAGTSYSLSTVDRSFGVAGFSPSQGANGGNVTLTISGVQFTPSTTVSLVAANGAATNPTQVYYQDSSTIYATFNLSALAAGAYKVSVADGGESSTASGAFTVAAGPPGAVQVLLITPSAARIGRTATVTVSYTNTGDTDVLAPLLSLTADGALVRLPDQTTFSGNSVSFLGLSGTGPAGIFAPVGVAPCRSSSAPRRAQRRRFSGSDCGRQPTD